MADDRTEEEKAADWAKLSESLKRAKIDLDEAILELSGYHMRLAEAENAFVWLKTVDRCSLAAARVSEMYAALKRAILEEPFKR